jgi:hypothetical protein
MPAAGAPRTDVRASERQYTGIVFALSQLLEMAPPGVLKRGS